ncbi:MAG: GTPase RsgA, partial [Lachnospiraceae bacterium]|nr:GTPase RsgA [Lachnospiraceae bacterium]
MQGKIIKGIAGFYYVHVGGKGIYECKAKGVFRKENIKPLVGDDVRIEVTDAENFKGNIVEILPRRSELIRPAVANIDQALLIFAMSKPEPNYNLLDRFLIMMEQQGLECIICFNKRDIASKEEREQIRAIYENSNC